jgi:hypothetical protein
MEVNGMLTLLGGMLLFALDNIGYGRLSLLQTRIFQVGNVFSMLIVTMVQVWGAANDVWFPRVCWRACVLRRR